MGRIPAHAGIDEVFNFCGNDGLFSRNNTGIFRIVYKYKYIQALN